MNEFGDELFAFFQIGIVLRELTISLKSVFAWLDEICEQQVFLCTHFLCLSFVLNLLC